MTSYLKIILGLMIVFLTGCATYKGAGSEVWHKTRLLELETAYNNKEINRQEYLSLKNEVDQIRVDYLKRDDYDSHIGIGYWGYYH